MRLWSLHPSLLDRAALVAGWREALLAQKVLAGGTRGYTRHPQLRRFQAHPAPLEAIGGFLTGLQEEATTRGYRFDLTRVLHPAPPASLPPIEVTAGQLAYELEHLRVKCERRSPEHLALLPAPGDPVPAHPLLRAVPGDVEDWEVR
ncbi:pyrimidine dimer DNA glycosylase/endonuclease V [Brachybacterium squillarum]|uniref:pyrimidine dimer DNA glycosylase/endonuclease V n=1 Tax=Brachybacterium squillarum TaxID=661979 RepID=UPI002223354D|nr:pyrimidine dimer DNA glycosylase/endonuclease V [Brachybacterium squillarum]MCW1805492.1 pyrimidine dimer DNA glycosylase/endonuclease V [Brachybacterium squillarum]